MRSRKETASNFWKYSSAALMAEEGTEKRNRLKIYIVNKISIRKVVIVYSKSLSDLIKRPDHCSH